MTKPNAEAAQLPGEALAAQSSNVDQSTVANFADEWSTFDQTALSEKEHREMFDAYFSIFPFDELAPDAEGFDLGCGSGRWAALVAPRVGALHCIDPAEAALNVARRRMGHLPNVRFHAATSQTMSLDQNSQDFGYSLGVLHHIPDTEAALKDCVARLKPGAPFLLYLYYKLENRPLWFRLLWASSDILRRLICRLPSRSRLAVTTVIAGIVYWPLARFALAAEWMGADVKHFPLAFYRRRPFYTMRTDALDRFGTPLEQRFSRTEIEQMMQRTGLTGIQFKEGSPYWVALGRKTAERPPS
jgi:ubiquinone/menaquinone biosynthesis C-methylase UbiE